MFSDVLDDFDKPKQPATGKQPAKSKAANSDEDDLLEQFEAEMMAKLMGGAAGNNNSSNNNKSNDKGLEADMMAKLLAGLAGNDDNDNGSEADMMKKLIAGLAGNNDNDNGNDNKNTDDDKPSLVPHLTTRPPGPGPKKEIDDLEKYFDQSGIDPLDFMKALINETTEEGPSKANQPTPAATAAVQELLENDRAKQGTFQDTVQQTLERMRESGEKATAAATEDGDNTNDLFEQVLKAIDVNPGAGGDMDINKMFMSMMEQLSNKEMLYEPMKELHTKFGPWLQENRDKVAADELERYETQARLVGEIVSKFDEPDFSDDKPECRSYIWDRMQAVRLFSFLFYLQEILKLTIDADASSRKPAGRPHCKPATRRALRWRRRGTQRPYAGGMSATVVFEIESKFYIFIDRLAGINMRRIICFACFAIV